MGPIKPAPGTILIPLKVLFISAGSILVEIEKSTILTQFFRIEMVEKSIFEKIKKIESEPKNRDDKKSLKRGPIVATFLTQPKFFAILGPFYID